jgi:hypothetical protein
VSRALALSSLCAALAVLGGCGSGGAEPGATVSVYVSARLCPAAQRQLRREGGRAGELRVRARCLEEERRGGRLDLATVGANARRATEDSTAVAYVEARDPAAAQFADAILESAGIASFRAVSGATAMRRVLAAVRGAEGGGSLRGSVRDELLSG